MSDIIKENGDELFEGVLVYGVNVGYVGYIEE